ncbi:MAG: hypothetical protein EXR90_06465 [Methyloglobulus sp.]|nr:hypothetical protein [Methyloglobulus sp.]
MSTKEEYEVDALEAKASDAMDDLKPEMDAQIANLKVKFAEGEGKFNELADAAEEAWEDLKVDAEAMSDNLISDVKEDLEVAATEAKGFFAKIMSAFK